MYLVRISGLLTCTVVNAGGALSQGGDAKGTLGTVAVGTKQLLVLSLGAGGNLTGGLQVVTSRDHCNEGRHTQHSTTELGHYSSVNPQMCKTVTVQPHTKKSTFECNVLYCCVLVQCR